MMPERPVRLEILERLEVPDLWPEVSRRGSNPPRGGPPRVRKAGIVFLALLIAGSGFLLVTRLWRAPGHPATSPSPTLPVPSGDGLIYFRAQVRFGVPSAWEAIHLDGTGRRTVFSASGPFMPESVAFSPDGQRIAADLVGRPGIWIANVDGSHAMQLTSGANDAWPAWSPDGTTIAFAGSTASEPCPSRRFYSCPRDLYVVNVDGSGLHLVAQDAIQPSWSPEGDRIAFETTDREGFALIEVVNADGTGEHVVAGPPAGGSDLAPAWSPDGSTIVYSSIRLEDWGIYSVAATGGAERTLVSAGSPLGSVDDPTWSPDGTTVAFVASGGIDVMAPDGSHVRELVHLDTNYGPGAIAWQPAQATQEVTPTPTSAPTSPPSVDPNPSANLGIAPPPASASSLLYAFGSIWVAWFDASGAAHVTRIDPVTNEVVATIPIDDSPGWVTGGGGMAEGFGSLWVTGSSRQGGLLQRIDPATNRMTSELQLGQSPSLAADVAVDENSVWTATMPLEATGSSFLYQIDPATEQVLTEIPLQYEYERQVLALDGTIIVRQNHWHDGGSGPYIIFTAIDATTGGALATSKEDAFIGMWIAGGELWATIQSDTGGYELTRVDPLTLSPVGDPVPFEADRLGSFEGDDAGIWFVTAAGLNHWQQPVEVNRFDVETGTINVSDEVPEAGGQDMAIGGDAIWFLKDGDVLRFRLS